MKLSNQASEQTVLLIRSALGVGVGSVTSATTALVIKVIDNILKKGYISKGDIANIIHDNPELAEIIWNWLIAKKYVEIEESKSEEELFKAEVADKCS